MKLSLAFSPCPNDTFIFDALVHHKIDTEGFEFDVQLEDVQTLNEWAIDGKMDISKISYGVLPLVMNHYTLLNSGGALGMGVGPLLITRANSGVAIEQKGGAYTLPAGATIAIPGKNTTAHLLFSLAFPEAQNKVFSIFNQIEDAVLSGKVDAGVIIHENRFTYQDKGLVKLTDLGAYWEETLQVPIPLGGIIIKKTIDPAIAATINRLIRQSIQYAFDHYPQVADYVKQHAQEMSEEVMRKHIDLYVNRYSLDLGPDGHQAVAELLRISDAQLH
ncbi:MAG TPA: 1,4-dihydroxy-6-naphthoate synthase [Sediminibacterium sp.]|nr:1,4-dihydroxy-6-naphthoate synthase [Sediminibacterium sp.]